MSPEERLKLIELIERLTGILERTTAILEKLADK